MNACEWGLNEIMDNVIQHSNENVGFVMGQILKRLSNFKNLNFRLWARNIQIATTPSNKSQDTCSRCNFLLQSKKVLLVIKNSSKEWNVGII